MFNQVRMFSLAVIGLASAASAGPLQVVSQISAERHVRAADGSTSVVLGPATKVVPGDHVVFTLTYRNTGGQALGNLVFDNPVPRGIAYRGPAAGSVAPDLSVDGALYGPLASLRVRTPAGPRAATADDVTHVRWRLAAPLPAGGQGRFAFAAVLK